MKILLDECVPKDIKKFLSKHEVSTVIECGWSGIKNGALLKLARTNFDVFITVDKNLSFQQNTYKLPIPVIVIHSHSNKLKYLEPILPSVVNVLEASLELKVYHCGEL